VEPAPAAEAGYATAAYDEGESESFTSRYARQILFALGGAIVVLGLAGLVQLILQRLRGPNPSAPTKLISSNEEPAYLPQPALKVPPPPPPRDEAVQSRLLKSYFVSHATGNSAEAKKLVAALEAKGITCWIAPRNIKAGQAYGDAIGAAVARLTKATIVLVSAAAEKRDGVKAELELARRFQKPIVPVIINNHPPGKGMLYYIGTSHWVPFDGASAETINALADAVSD
jgi:hypothetical protein